MSTSPWEALGEFGLPDSLPRRVAEQMTQRLTELWRAAHRREPAGLRRDLAAQHEYFNPVAQGARLREVFLEIEPVELADGLIPSAMKLDIDSDRHLITPEGRVALTLLQKGLEADGSTVGLDASLAQQYERELLDLYRDWARHRQRQVIDLMEGGTTPFQLPAMGAALTLLVNRSDSPERAITRFPKEQRAARQTIDMAFFACAQAFADTLEPPKPGKKRRTQQKEQLVSGWTLGEVRRRLPNALVLETDRVYVAPGQQGALLQRIVVELHARKKVFSLGVVEDAFDALVAAFHTQAEALAGYGLLFERPSNTRQLRTELADRWRRSA